MDNAPKISVIVPVYKVEKYLPQCIESILAQTFTDFELLLIDDGSPDCCGEICEDYARNDKRIRVFHQDNAGLSCARNTGLENSLGKYVTYIDSDDYVKSCYLKNIYSMLPSDNSLRGMIVGGLDKINANGEIHTVHVPEQDIFSDKKYIMLTELIDRDVNYAASKLYDNRLIKKYNIRFVPSVSGLEDMLFMLDYLLYTDYIFIRDVNDYIYRVGYSTDALSVRINGFQAEYAAFSNLLSRVYAYQQIYGLKDSSLAKIHRSLTVFFHKIILAIYKSDNNYSRKQRLCFLHQILSENRHWIKKHFLPQYKADKYGKFLLCFTDVFLFDFWMRFLLAINVKKRFGVKKEEI